MNNDAVAFIVPSTTHDRDWRTIEETYLYSVLFSSLEYRTPTVPVSVYVGYDSNDPILSQEQERLKCNAVFLNFTIIWIEIVPDPGNVVKIWNKLAEIALSHHYDWLMVLGDDIRLPNDRDWLTLFQKALRKQKYIGWAAGWSNNNDIATQFLVHRTHWSIFEFIFPPLLKNWHCDNWLNDVYSKKHKYWRKDYPLLNTGGNPRYIPNDHAKLCQMLVKRHKPEIQEFINLVSKINY